MKIFISYSSKDRDAIKRIFHALTLSKADVFYDAGLRSGENWQSRLDWELKQTDSVLVVWSPNSTKSKEVIKEIEIALSYNKKVFFCCIDECTIPEKFAHLNAAKLQKWGGRLQDRAWVDLLRELGLEPTTARYKFEVGYAQLEKDTRDLLSFNDATFLTKTVQKFISNGYKIVAISEEKILLRKERNNGKIISLLRKTVSSLVPDHAVRSSILKHFEGDTVQVYFE